MLFFKNLKQCFFYIKGIPSYFFQHFFEIAKRIFIIKENNLYCTLMCKNLLHSTNPTKRLSFTLFVKGCLVDRHFIDVKLSFLI